MSKLLPIERIEKKIFVIRGKNVMLDKDLAELYGIKTKVLNQAVKRNVERFPDDFMFHLTNEEKFQLVTNCDRFNSLKHSTSLPYAFTEYGALMLANIIKTKTAIDTSIMIVRTFTRFRELLSTHKELKQKMEEMEGKYDQQFKVVFDALKQLLEPPDSSNRKIGF